MTISLQLSGIAEIAQTRPLPQKSNSARACLTS